MKRVEDAFAKKQKTGEDTEAMHANASSLLETSFGAYAQKAKIDWRLQ